MSKKLTDVTKSQKAFFKLKSTYLAIKIQKVNSKKVAF